MKLKLKLPFWLTDPERFWQRLAAGLGILALDLFLVCCWQQVEKAKYQTNVRELSRLNDSQRKMIGQIGEGLGQVMSKLDKIEQEQKNQPQPIIVPVPIEEPAMPASAGAAEGAAAPNPVAAGAAPSLLPVAETTLTADLNADGIVDWADFELFARYWGNTGSAPADFTRDGVVDWQDFQVFTNEWMKTEPWYTVRDNFTEEDQYANRQPVR